MTTKKSILVAALFVILSASFLYSEKVNISDSPGLSKWPSIAVNHRGEAIIVWSEFDGSGFQLWYRFYNPETGVWAREKNMQAKRENAEIAQLAPDKYGNFHLSYSDGLTSRSREIYYARYITETGTWQPKELVYQSDENSAWNRTGVDEDTVYVMWYHEHGPPYEADIILNWKQIGASWQQRRQDVSQDANATAIHPAFRALNGNIYACFMQNVGPSDSPAWRIYYSERVNGQWIVPFDIGGSHWPALEADDKFSVANVHALFPTKDGSMWYKSRINGVWRPELLLNTSHAEPGFADIKFMHNVLVAAIAQEANDGTGLGVFVRKRDYNNGWGGWQAPIQVSDGIVAEYPQIGLDNFGYVHVCWQDLVSGDFDIFWDKVKIYDAPPFILLDKTSFSFSGEEFGPNPAGKDVRIKNGGADTLNYEFVPQQNWISTSPSSGTSTSEWDTITINLDISQLPEGTYTGSIQVTSPNGSNSPQTITVNLTITAPHIYAPNNFKGQAVINRTLFSRETIHHFEWAAHNLNRDITNYRIYEVYSGVPILLVELNSNTFSYIRRNMDPTKAYTYRIAAVDNRNRTGDTAEVTIAKQQNLTQGEAVSGLKVKK